MSHKDKVMAALVDSWWLLRVESGISVSRTEIQYAN